MNDSLIERWRKCQYLWHNGQPVNDVIEPLMVETIEALKPVEDDDSLIELLYEITGDYSEQAWQHGAILKAIKALKPVEDTEVKAVLSLCQTPSTRDLIERLVREKGELEGKLIAAEKGCAILAESLRESDQRIEELEAAHKWCDRDLRDKETKRTSLEITVNYQQKRIEELKAVLDNVLELISRDTPYVHTAIAKIEYAR